MDEIKNKIKNILKNNFDLDIKNDDEKIFHHLDSINNIRYIILIENNFNININSEVVLSTINETVDYIKKHDNN